MKEAKVAVSEKEKGYDVILFDLFRSINLTIFLLILLAILSIIGTVITQNAASEAYIERYGSRLYEVLDFFDLFDMYHSWWFSTILLLLVVNLVACSLHRFPGVWNQFFRKAGAVAWRTRWSRPFPMLRRVLFQTLPNESERSDSVPVEESDLSIRNGSRRNQPSPSFRRRGRFSRLGVYIAHLSLIIILIGGLIGSLFGFKGFVNILEGETVDRIGVRTKDKMVERPIPFSVRCDDFKVAFYDVPGNQRFVKEYTSILTILENGKEVLKKTVQVNHPLHYRGLTFYQSSYGSYPGGHRRSSMEGQKGEDPSERWHEGETLPIPNSNAFIRMVRYVPQILNLGEGLQMVLLRPNQPPQPLWALKDPSKIDQRNEEFIVSFEGISVQEYTGLQVAKDPGVWVVWIGCALLIVGLIVSFFFSHQRVWVRIPKGPGKRDCSCRLDEQEPGRF